MSSYKPNKSNKVLNKYEIDKKMEHLTEYLKNDYDATSMNFENGRVLAELRREVEKKWNEWRDFRDYVPPKIVIADPGEGVRRYVEENCRNKRVVYIEDEQYYEKCDTRTEVIAIKYFDVNKHSVLKFYQELPFVNIYEMVLKPRVIVIGLIGDFKRLLGKVVYNYIEDKTDIIDVRQEEKPERVVTTRIEEEKEDAEKTDDQSN